MSRVNTIGSERQLLAQQTLSKMGKGPSRSRGALAYGEAHTGTGRHWLLLLWVSSFRAVTKMACKPEVSRFPD